MGTISGRECGARMAAALLPVLDPLGLDGGGAPDEAVPTFEKPKMVGAAAGAAPLRVDRAMVPGCDTYQKIKAHSSLDVS